MGRSHTYPCMANKRTIVGTSTRLGQSSTTVNYPNTSDIAPMTKDEYLAGILQGYPGEGVKREPAYSQAPPGVIGSRANGMFLN